MKQWNQVIEGRKVQYCEKKQVYNTKIIFPFRCINIYYFLIFLLPQPIEIEQKGMTLITIFTIIILFFFPLFLGGKRKGEKNNKRRCQKSCLSDRSSIENPFRIHSSQTSFPPFYWRWNWSLGWIPNEDRLYL